MIAASLAPAGAVGERREAQQWLRTSGYTPSHIRIAPFKRVGARLFGVNARFDDHGGEAQASGRYQVVSVESVVRFATLLDPAARQQLAALD